MSSWTGDLLLGFSIMILCLVIAYRDSHPRGQTVPLRDAVKITFDALGGLITLAIILGGILLGVFAAIASGPGACAWAFFVPVLACRASRWAVRRACYLR